MALVATITIDHTKVSADLTDYIVFVDLARLTAKFWKTVANGGGDIRCYKSDGTTELAREVVSCATSTETGELHVKYSGTLSSTVDTVIQIHADGTSSEPAVTATYGRNAVWSDYWAVFHMEGSVGSTGKKLDSTGNGRNLIEYNTPEGSATGKLGTSTTGAYNMLGLASGTSATTYDYLSVNDLSVESAIGTSPFVISWWYKLDLARTQQVMGICEEQNSATGRPQLMQNAETTSFYHGNYIETSSSNGNSVYTTTAVNTINTWYFVTMGRDTSDYLTAFANGNYATSASTEGGAFTSPNQKLLINRRYNPTYSSAQQYSDGQYDEVRFRFSHLPETWLDTEYANQNSPSTFYAVSGDYEQIIDTPIETGLVSAWDFDETSGTRYDGYGNNDLSDNNSVLYATGVRGNGADFEYANSEYLSITDASQSGLEFSTTFSASFFFKLESDKGGYHMFFSKDNSGVPNRQYFFAYDDNVNKFDLYVFQDGNIYWNGNISYTINTGTWYHVVITFNAGNSTGSKCKYYINGVDAGTVTEGGTCGSIQNTTQPFLVGFATLYTTSYLDGVMDDLRMWSRVLTASEASALYNVGASLPLEATSAFIPRTACFM
jgi:hypothetical protein